MTKTPNISDVLIIGGSHAGMSAALTLYRALHTCIIFDSEEPRAHYSTPARLMPTWEHADVEDFKEAARKELRDTGFCRFVNVTITEIRAIDHGMFLAVDSNGKEWLGRKVLLAIGEKDRMLPIEGYESLYAWGIFQCMFQFGYEHRGSKTAGLIAQEGLGNVFHAKMLADDANKYAEQVTIYTNSNPTLADEIKQALQVATIQVDNRKLRRLSKGTNKGEVIIEFEDGTRKLEQFIVHRPDTELDRTFIDQLGLEISERGDILTVPPFCQTTVPGVYAAGDCASPMKIIPNAISMGAYAGCGLSRELPVGVTGRRF